MDACVVIDVSAGMREWAVAVRTAMASVSRMTPPDTRIAVVTYCAQPEPDVLTDFTSNRSTVSKVLSRIEIQPEAGETGQRLAMCYALSPTRLGWRAPEDARGGVVLHFTATSPRTDGAALRAERELAWGEAGVSDWIDIGRAFSRSGVVVHTFLFRGPGFGRDVCWQAAMAALTSSDGVILAGKSAREIEKTVARLMDGRAPCGGSRARMCAEAIERLSETSCEENAGRLLGDVSSIRVDGPDNDARVAVASFAGLVRSDATNRRLAMNVGALEAELRESHAWLRKEVSEALTGAEGEGETAYDSISASTLRESCADFASRECSDLPDMFSATAMIVFGPAICAPLTANSRPAKKSFNFQTGFGIRVSAVRAGYQISYGRFLDYLEAKKRSWRSCTLDDLRCGVDDLVLRSDGQITGVLPVVADGSALARRVYAALARTPWANAVAWHSTCRHVCYPPHACLGLLCASMWAGCADASVPESTLARIRESISYFKAPARGCGELPRAIAFAALSGDRDGQGLTRACAALRWRRTDRVVAGVVRLRRAMGLPGLEDAEAALAACFPKGRENPPPRPAPPPCGLHPGTKPFDRALMRVLRGARRAMGLPMTGEAMEKFTLDDPDAIPESAELSAGIALIREHGPAVFVYTREGEWLATALGRMTRIRENRGGRIVHAWRRQEDTTSSS